jgi:hypothetical protein
MGRQGGEVFGENSVAAAVVVSRLGSRFKVVVGNPSASYKSRESSRGSWIRRQIKSRPLLGDVEKRDVNARGLSRSVFLV